VEGVLDFAKDVLRDAAKVIVSESIVGAEKARSQSVRVPFGRGERDKGRGVGISMVKGIK